MTTHQDVLNTITRSMPTEWHVVTNGGLGPAYHDRFGRVTDGDGTNWLDHDAHYGQAVYRDDVQLTIAWGTPHPTRPPPRNLPGRHGGLQARRSGRWERRRTA